MKNYQETRNDARHKKTAFKVFVVVIPKEGLGPRQSFIGYDNDYTI